MKLYPFQQQALIDAEQFNRCAFYYDMGLGKTFIGSEKAISLGKNILIICQKSKVNDWIKHFEDNYKDANVWNLTKSDNEDFMDFVHWSDLCTDYIGVINYELAWRRKELEQLKDFTLMLDESSLIANEKSKQSKYILDKLHPANVILLSGTPCSGKYEQLWSQCHLLGWEISKTMFYNQFVIKEPIKRYNGTYLKDARGFIIQRITGYKNIDRLKGKLATYGAFFKRTDEVFDLPEQVSIDIKISESKEFKKFVKTKVVEIDDDELVGDSELKKMLYCRMLCGHYSKEKLKAFEDLLNSTSDRLIVFYNFKAELNALKQICIDNGRDHLSYINGSERDLSAYEEFEDSVTLIQYQAGSMGLNLQKANKIVYFTPTQRSDFYEQSKKRIHRIGQSKSCFYYRLVCGVDEDIYEKLDMRQDYTAILFKNKYLV